MQTRNPFMDDFSKLMQGASGMAQAANEEAKALFRSMTERIVGNMDLAKREEVEALKAVARSAVENAEALERRVAELEARLGGAAAPADKRP
jgi:BMFP domain-containing protein YqiC